MDIGDGGDKKNTSTTNEGPHRDSDDRDDEPLTAVDDDEGTGRKVDDEWDDSDEGDEPGDPDVAAAPAAPVARKAPAPESETERQESSTRSGRPDRFRQERRAPPATIQELFESEIPQRVQYADEKLRQHLAGSILVRISASAEKRPAPDRKASETRYLFDWSSEKLNCQATDRDNADCVISISDVALMRIANGDLNAQVGMLSDKMKVEGQAALAVYFFNLVSPSSGSFV